MSLQWVEEMKNAGADQYTFHIEATEHPGALIRQIKEAGMKVGLLSVILIDLLRRFSCSVRLESV